jgi:hypothetical protein
MAVEEGTGKGKAKDTGEALPEDKVVCGRRSSKTGSVVLGIFKTKITIPLIIVFRHDV